MGEPTVNFHVQVRLPQFKIPTELIKKNFKSIQKLIEKQKKQVTDEITKINKNQALPTAVKLQLVRKLIAGFEQFQKKLTDAIQKDEEYRERLIARKEHLLRLNDFVKKEEQQEIENDDEGEHQESTVEGSANNLVSTDTEKGANSAALPGELDLSNYSLINWYREEMNLLLVDYLIRSNIGERASKEKGDNLGITLLESLSAKSPGISKLIDFDVYEEFNKVYTLIIISHDLNDVINWFNENKLLLKKINSNLEFEIKYCRLLSLIEKNQVSEAIRYSQENLSMYGNKENYNDFDMAKHPTNLNKLKSIGGLLLYLSINESSNTFSSNLVINSNGYKEHEKLLSHGRWDSLAQCFLDDFNTLYGILKNYPLFVYLSAGLSSLKTKSCYCNEKNTVWKSSADHKDEDTAQSNNTKNLPTSKRLRGPNQYYSILSKVNNCPVCSPELFALSKNLPYAQLITKIFNNPRKLPNGNIYPFDMLLHPELQPGILPETLESRKQLLDVDKIKDPLTNEIFNCKDCVRVYPA